MVLLAKSVYYKCYLKTKKHTHNKKHKTCFYEKNKKTRNQYALPPEGNAIPAQAT